MTEENIKRNITSELERAAEVFRAAMLLHSNGLINDAVSRLYYFLLHMVRALLLSRGLEPKSHEGALRLFAMYFVKENIFKVADAHVFSKLMKYREEADYNPLYMFTAEDFLGLQKEAEILSAQIKQYLSREGYLL
jgi:hypothetical protein